ncbi:hypothetical protein SBOR_2703 [Sclerotinia borealis F-4128]|uniref:Uncharacterized protein n=1 Tax=Sclerotinia borealis (strain F-4128) TaxID=1432307 RepID=W9CQM7_SCLBF|nr:hypothetical protein SBOR_2703 [Sclerotinia borealis F-4128]
MSNNRTQRHRDMHLTHISGFSTANEWLIEEGSAILGACVPTFRPILKAYFRLPKSINDWFSSVPGSSTSATASKFSNGHIRNRLQLSQSKDEQGPSFQLKKLSPAYIQRGKERRNRIRDHDEDSDDILLVDNRIWVTRHVTTSG